MRKAAIIQSSYIPWRGYFDIIHDVDVFVFLDDVQYTKNDWRNRNRVKTPGGSKWLTVPVIGGIHQRICDARIDYTRQWQDKHRKTIQYNYQSCAYFNSYKDDILGFIGRRFDTISELNTCAIKGLAKILGIRTRMIASTDMGATGRKDDRVVNICQKLGVDHYLSGPSARDYIVPEKFEKAGITLEYKDYGGYPEYPQPHGAFDHFVSVIDLLFSSGDKAPYYIWGWREK